MRFDVTHELHGAAAAVVDGLFDPHFHVGLELPDVGTPEVVRAEAGANPRVLDLRYEYVGSLDPIIKRLLAGRKLTWLQRLELDTAAGRGQLTIVADADPKRLSGTAAVTVTAIDAAVTRLAIHGELRVNVPLLGGTAERKLVPGIVQRLDLEAVALNEYINPD
jgi:hypothetical protein